MFNNRNPFSEISEKDPSRASGWVQAAHWAFGYVQVRQGKYQGMSAPAARRRPGPRLGPPPLPLNKVLGSQRGYGLLAGTAASLSLPELEGLGSNILIISTFKLDLIKKGHTPS